MSVNLPSPVSTSFLHQVRACARARPGPEPCLLTDCSPAIPSGPLAVLIKALLTKTGENSTEGRGQIAGGSSVSSCFCTAICTSTPNRILGSVPREAREYALSF